MNDRQIAFIICSNNAQYYNECVRYIQELEIPQGYETDVICVQEAESMAQGYNAGMQASNAKYKVYLHQDTFIINRNFINDMLKVFEDDDSIGMLGVIGVANLQEDADCYLKWQIGHIETFDAFTTIDGEFWQDSQKLYIPVKAIGGPIMVTQHDVPWREDILEGWDFYDISQSIEMGRYGYKVVVPYQEKPWCYHDCGVSKLWNYDFYRDKMIAAYPEEFPGSVGEQDEQKRRDQIREAERIRKELIHLIEIKAYEQIEAIFQEVNKISGLDTQICEIMNLSEIYTLEKNSVSGVFSGWFNLCSWEQIREYYTWVRFVLLRAGYRREDERIAELKSMMEQGEISRDAIRKIATAILKDTTGVYEQFLGHLKEEPLVSVIVQVYNGEDVIGRTLESILGQTYQNMEILISDDASTDKSREIISSFAQKDKRVKPIYFDKNRNICYGGNACAKIANGKYLVLAGHDDIWRKDKLEKQILFMEEHPVYGACFTWVDIIDENEQLNNAAWSRLYNRFLSTNIKADAWLRKLFFSGNFFCAPSACIRKEIVDKVGFYRYGLIQLQDYELWLRVLLEAPVYIIQEKLTLYRRFNTTERNLSAVNEATQRRDCHESQWICEDFVSKLSVQRFVQIFKRDMRNPNASEEKEIQCEKAFLLWRMGICAAEKWFIELLEDEECRDILEEKYAFGLQEFYKLNKEPRKFDEM